MLYISLLLGVTGCRSEVFSPDDSSVASLWSYVRRSTVAITDDIYISGHIVANDLYGELNKAIVVADDSGSVLIDVDMDDTARLYPLYSRVSVRCSGLWLGTIGPKLLLGAEPLGDFVVDRIPATRVQNYLSVLPDNDNTPTLRRRKIAELEYRDVLGYVAIDGVALVAEEQGMLWADVDADTQRPVTTVRHFHCNGDTLRVVTDAKCHYASEPIPTHSLCLSGILDWYNGDFALRIINHGIDRSYL